MNESTLEPAIRIVYTGQDRKRQKQLASSGKNVIILLFDRWDDFDYKTTLPTECWIAGEQVELGSIQILFEGVTTTHDHLSGLLMDGWDGEFPIPTANYISTPADLTFYEQIAARLGLNSATAVGVSLRDASLLTRIHGDTQALELIGTTGFTKSLQRERGAVRSFLDGWKLFDSKDISVENQHFSFASVLGNGLTLDLRFSSPRPMPYDINVLIGPNGVGKSQLLQGIVKEWLDVDTHANWPFGFEERPNFSQLVAVSYSPFEQFPVDTADTPRLKDTGTYRYFGLRGRRNRLGNRTTNGGKITLSRDFPRADAAQSLLHCLTDDQKYGSIRDWSRKLETVERVLGQAIDFDRAAIEVEGTVELSEFFTDEPHWIDQPSVELEQEFPADVEVGRLIPIGSDRLHRLNATALRTHLREKKGVVFLKEGNPVELSSGQRLFSYIVINILGAIRRNSLIVIDEPELFLHPTLEISFLRMLKSILTAYRSKALIATHSLVTVREMPSDCVHVFERTEDMVFIKTPPFETFGGDIQRISSYVFGDKSISKPYEDWVRTKLQEFGSASAFLEALGDDVNEEMIIQINAMGAGKW